ncbi:uncharacterized protein LOC144101920 isoform X3 [Amblyomma americanum]
MAIEMTTTLEQLPAWPTKCPDRDLCARLHSSNDYCAYCECASEGGQWLRGIDPFLHLWRPISRTNSASAARLKWNLSNTSSRLLHLCYFQLLLRQAFIPSYQQTTTIRIPWDQHQRQRIVTKQGLQSL